MSKVNNYIENITDQIIENFDHGEIEAKPKSKEYVNQVDDAQDSGKDNAYYNISLRVRLGGYCMTAEKSLKKAYDRREFLESKMEAGELWSIDAHDVNEANIVNAEQEQAIFRSVYDDLTGFKWTGIEDHLKALDEIFSPKEVGGKTAEMKDRAETILIKARTRKTGRSLAEQTEFEKTFTHYEKSIRSYKVLKPSEIANICKMPRDKGEALLNEAIKSLRDIKDGKVA